MYEEAIRQNIRRKDWRKLSEVMIGADLAGVRKLLRRRGWYQVGLFEAERENHPAAIIALNSARRLDPKPDQPLNRMLEQIEAFCQDFDGRFSREDLYMLLRSVERVNSFHSFHSKVATEIQEKGKRLVGWIESQLSEASLKEETPATHHVQRIYSALYPPMTIEEVRAEFARIVEPLIRERLERKPMPASSGGGKGPKDPEDDIPEPPKREPKPMPKRKKRKPKGGK
jgi:hypothetical protein